MNCLVKSVDCKLNRGKIFPLFIPFAGCPFRCIFCAQERQTGTGRQSAAEALRAAYADFPVFLENCRTDTADLAFYGGTFTAVAENDFRACLEFFAQAKKAAHKKNIRLSGRCSTRPDSLSAPRLHAMKEAGIDLIELGIQSFSDPVLEKSRRGYTPETAEKACRTVQDAGFKLGIQLMAGLPGQSQAVFLDDVRKALALAPACLRYYPCLVPRDTPLAVLFAEKKFLPWTDGQCIETLGTALAMAWEKGIPVIRLSVAPEKAFDESLLAGPRHPSLGSDIQSRALFETVAKTLSQNSGIQTVALPLRFKSSLFGTKKRLLPAYEQKIPLKQLVFEKNLTNEIKFFNGITS